MRCITLPDSKPRGADAQLEFMHFVFLRHRRMCAGPSGRYLHGASDHRDPLNLGTDELVTIKELVDMVARSLANRSRSNTILVDLKACVVGTATIS